MSGITSATFDNHHSRNHHFCYFHCYSYNHQQYCYYVPLNWCDFKSIGEKEAHWTYLFSLFVIQEVAAVEYGETVM